jgi:hypothetical protein
MDSMFQIFTRSAVANLKRSLLVHVKALVKLVVNRSLNAMQ